MRVPVFKRLRKHPRPMHRQTPRQTLHHMLHHMPRQMPRLCSRALTTMALATLLWTGARAAPATAALPAASSPLAVAEVRVGVERLAKLHFELTSSADPQRTRRQLQRERERIFAALQVLQADKALTLAQRSRVASLTSGVGEYAQRIGEPAQPAEIYRDSESLVARLTFLSTALSARDPALGALLDLVTRAAATALRVGKINLARAGGLQLHSLEVDTTQALVEFRSALEAIGAQRLDESTQAELTLAQHQWILLRSALTARGLVQDTARLKDLASTSDFIAESLLALARRASRTNAPLS